MPSAFSSIKKEVPHIIVLIILVVVLLVVLTKFGWVHCSQVPGNWCEIYCKHIMRAHSRVALVYGDEGLGDPEALENMIRRTRGYTYIEPFHASVMSGGVLEGYDLVIVEKTKYLSFGQATALNDYLNKGGTLLWIGDAGTGYYFDEFGLAQALNKITEVDKQRAFKKNQSLYDLTVAGNISDEALENQIREIKREALLEQEKTVKGFGPLQNALRATFVKNHNESKELKGLKLKIVGRNHLIMSGLKPEFGITTNAFAEVHEDTAATTVLATLRTREGEDYPAIFETRYAGKIVYIAFPLEDVNSTTLLTNLMDYLIVC